LGTVILFKPRVAQRGGALTMLAEWLVLAGVLAFGGWFLWFAGVR
jgi:hypothetical protein